MRPKTKHAIQIKISKSYFKKCLFWHFVFFSLCTSVHWHYPKCLSKTNIWKSANHFSKAGHFPQCKWNFEVIKSTLHKSRCDNYDLSRTLLVYSVTPPCAPPMNLKWNHMFWMKKMASFINFDEKRIRFPIYFDLTKLLACGKILAF